jgi:hypothetical protein
MEIWQHCQSSAIGNQTKQEESSNLDSILGLDGVMVSMLAWKTRDLRSES